MKKMRAAIVWSTALASISLAPIVLAQNAAAQSAPVFNKQQVTISIGYGAGGTYYQYAQLFSRHLGNFLPGNPTIIVQTAPGAGGVRLLNDAAVHMPGDGSNIFIPPDTTVVSQLLTSGGGIQYDARRFAFIGTADQENNFIVTRRSVAASLADLKKRQTFMGSSGAGATGFLIPAIAGPLLDLPMKPVGGYQGSRDIILGMERGELDGSAQGWQVWTQARPQWFEGKDSFAVPLIQVGASPDPDAPDTPLLSSLVAPDARGIVAMLDTIGVIGRSLAMPPSTPAAVRDVFRSAFERMVADPAYKADAEHLHLRSIPHSADMLESGVRTAIDNANPAIVDKARQLIK